MGGHAVVVTLNRSAALTNNSNKSLQGSAGLSYATVYRPVLEGFFLFFLCSPEDLRLTTNCDTFTDQTFNM